MHLTDDIYMNIYFRSLKGLPDTIKVMTTNYKQVFGLALGFTGIVSSGVILSKTPDVIIAQMQEQTKIIQEQTKQITSQEQTKQVTMQEKTKLMQEETKQMQEQTKQMQLKNRRKWLLF